MHMVSGASHPTLNHTLHFPPSPLLLPWLNPQIKYYNVDKSSSFHKVLSRMDSQHENILTGHEHFFPYEAMAIIHPFFFGHLNIYLPHRALLPCCLLSFSPPENGALPPPKPPLRFLPDISPPQICCVSAFFLWSDSRKLFFPK